MANKNSLKGDSVKKSQTNSKTTKKAPHLTVQQLTELLKEFRGVDSVELKLTVADADRNSTVAALDMDPLDAQIRQVVFFDTLDLTLNKAGIVVRARRIQGKPADSTVKLRPVVPSEVSAQQRASTAFSIELDVMPDGFVCSGSMKNIGINDVAVKEVLAGKRPIRKLFTKEQRALLAQHAPQGLELDALAILGPINVVKLRFSPLGFNRKMVAELWNYPDGSRILELSTKATPVEAQLVARGCGVPGPARCKVGKRSKHQDSHCPRIFYEARLISPKSPNRKHNRVLP